MRTTLCIRGLPQQIRDWLDESVQKGTSQNEFILDILRQAHEAKLEPTLFDTVTAAPAPSSASIPFKFIDLFAGIGGFRIGLTKLGGTCVFTSEWDRQAQRTYRAWYGDKDVHGDINEVAAKDIPDHDILAAGFPCQPFSIAGVSKKNALGRKHGFQCEEQGNLFFKICEIAEAKRPPVLLLENVKNLKGHDKGNTWKVIRSTLDTLRYSVFTDIIDAAAWVPQHRERIFIVGFDREVFGDNPPFEFPDVPVAPPPTLKAILEPRPEPKYTLTDHLWNYLQNYAKKHREKGNGFGFGLVGPDDISRTLSARYFKDGSEILIRQDGKNPRRLTPRECARLMGYTDENAKIFGHDGGFPIVVSDTQAYKQFGNSVVPAVVEAVGRKVLEVFRWHLDRTSGGCLIKGRCAPGRRAGLKQSA